jgi:hypothetical protein
MGEVEERTGAVGRFRSGGVPAHFVEHFLTDEAATGPGRA